MQSAVIGAVNITTHKEINFIMFFQFCL